MNERIDQLWGEALDQAVPETYTQLSHSQVLKVKQVFAELIVQECIEMSKLEAAHYSAQAVDAKSKQAFEFEFNSAATCLGVGLRIKKHFGVEE